MSDSRDAELPLENVDWSSWPKPPDHLRASVLSQTSRVVRRRAWRRRSRLIAGWALAYAAGIATAWLSWPREAVPPAPDAPKTVETAQVAVAQPHEEPPEEDLSPLSPEELRRRVAGAPRAEQRRLLRLAGDRYLYGSADMEAALDCYRQVLELTPRAELGKHDADESWLLAELKSSAVHYQDRLAEE